MYEIYSSAEFEKKYTYSGHDLGCCYTKEQTSFRLWAPTASSAVVCLHQSGTEGTDDLLKCIPMTADIQGTWVAVLCGDWNGTYYTYRITVDGTEVASIDPYAVSAGVNGNRGMIVDLSCTNPKDWDKDDCPVQLENNTDAVIYELHVRDFSSDTSSGMCAKGKFLAFTEDNTHTRFGQPTGISYIRSLGVTHVHLLPVYDYGSVDETAPEKSYNWGYDPVNFNLPEGSYSSNPYDGFSRIREMKQAIQALHRNGLGVIMDVVYNHVYHTFEFSMNKIVPGYFSREDQNDDLSNGSCCGNDTASERSMVRKFIVDSVNFWADEYHIDGFRFDLVGLIDVETIREIMETVRKKHPHTIFYGEGWNLNTYVTKPNIALAVQQSAPSLPGFAFFNDTIRDTLRGSVFDYHLPGYISGASVKKTHLLRCFQGDMDWSSCPNQIINYVSCHDNHTLYDRIAEAMPQATEAEIAQRSRFAAAFALLSTGVPFFQAGEEMLRSKKNSAGKYIGNSYRSPDRINSIKWTRLDEPEVQTTVQYYRGLLALRKSHCLFRLHNAEVVRQSISLLPDTADPITAFRLENEDEIIIAAYNAEESAAMFTLPEGTWNVYVAGNRAGLQIITQISGNVEIPGISAYVVILNKK